MFLIALQLDHAPHVCKSGLGMRLREGKFGYLQGVVLMQNFWNFKAIPDRNHFDIDSKHTHSEEIQVIPIERFQM